MTQFIVVIFSVAYLTLSIKRLDWAVMLMLAALPAYQLRFSVLGIPMTVLEVMILVAFTVWVVKNYKGLVEKVKRRFGRKLEIGNLKFVPYPFGWEIAGILLISWVAIIVAGGSASALGIWKAYFFEPVLVFILVLNVFRGDTNDAPMPAKQDRDPDSHVGTNPRISNSFEKVLWALAIGAFLVSGVAILERLTGWFSVENFWPRVTGPFPYPNALGLYLGPLVLLMLGWLINQITNYKLQITNKFQIPKIVFLFLTILMSVAAIVLAKSEGALVGVAVAILLFIGFVINERIIKNQTVYKIGMVKFFIIIAIFLFYPLIVLHVYPKYWYPTFENEKLNYIVKKVMLKDLSGEIRKQQWRETWEMMAPGTRWLLGTGLSGYKAAVRPFHVDGIFFNFENDPDFRTKIVWFDEKYKAEHWQPVEIYMYPHNFILNFWTELGILGALIFIWLIVKYFYTGFINLENKGEQYIIFGLIGAMVVIIAHGVVDVPYFKNDIAIVFWLLVAMMGMTKLFYSGEKIIK